MQILKLLKGDRLNPLKVFSLFLTLFALSIFFISKIPAPSELSCAVAGSVSVIDYSYFALVSLISSILIIVNIEMINRKVNIKSSLAAIVSGNLIALFGAACSICLIPTVGFAGFSIMLSFFAQNHTIIQVLGILVLLLAIIKVERKLNKNCNLTNCKI
jgi:hypothetical protein